MAADDKTEPATAKRRRDERKKGNVMQSEDIGKVATLFATTYTMLFMGSHILTYLTGFFTYCFSMIATGGINSVTAHVSEIAGHGLWSLINVAGLPLISTVIVSTLVTFAQTRGLVTMEKLKPDLSKLNPIKGAKNLFSLKKFVEALKNLLKISILFYIVYLFYMENVMDYAVFYFLDPLQSAAIFIEDIFALIFRIGMAFAAIAALDYMYQKWQYERDMRMSKQEIKDEYKQMEGDPKVKAKIKQTQMKMAMSRMMQSVPDADVVVRNPDHYAVALRYRERDDPAPMILAMGTDDLALRIVAKAEEHKVAVVVNVPLARALFASGEINHPIPPEFYQVVAELLVHIVKLDRGQTGQTGQNNRNGQPGLPPGPGGQAPGNRPNGPPPS